jgi:hypothetical protein
MDTFTVSFRDGSKVSFVAKDLEYAVLNIKARYHMHNVTMIECIGDWGDEEVAQ